MGPFLLLAAYAGDYLITPSKHPSDDDVYGVVVGVIKCQIDIGVGVDGSVAITISAARLRMRYPTNALPLVFEAKMLPAVVLTLFFGCWAWPMRTWPRRSVGYTSGAYHRSHSYGSKAQNQFVGTLFGG